MTPGLLTWGKGETEELSIVREKLSVLDKVRSTNEENLSFITVKFEEISGKAGFYFQETVNKGEGMRVYSRGKTGCHQHNSGIKFAEFIAQGKEIQ